MNIKIILLLTFGSIPAIVDSYYIKAKKTPAINAEASDILLWQSRLIIYKIWWGDYKAIFQSATLLLIAIRFINLTLI